MSTSTRGSPRYVSRMIATRSSTEKSGCFSGLLVDFMDQLGANAVVRGLRAVSDFEYEFQMALMNRHLNPRIETVFLMPKEEYSYLSSRLVKEVYRLGGHLDGLVPQAVLSKMAVRLGRPESEES